jgi:excinuclease ABC subunit C
VTFLKGEAHKKDYRRYRIKTVKGIDDYAMIKEIIQRRFKYGEDEKALPDLLLIDGGKGHLILADKELKSLDVSTPIISIAKKEEKLFVQGEPAPLNLKQNPRIQNLIMEIRDEAHRFAIQYHKKLRLRETMSSLLEEIPGIGKKRKTLLLKRFKSIKDLKNASIVEISRIPSIDVLIAKRIQQFLLEKS